MVEGASEAETQLFDGLAGDQGRKHEKRDSRVVTSTPIAIMTAMIIHAVVPIVLLKWLALLHLLRLCFRKTCLRLRSYPAYQG